MGEQQRLSEGPSANRKAGRGGRVRGGGQWAPTTASRAGREGRECGQRFRQQRGAGPGCARRGSSRGAPPEHCSPYSGAAPSHGQLLLGRITPQAISCVPNQAQSCTIATLGHTLVPQKAEADPNCTSKLPCAARGSPKTFTCESGPGSCNQLHMAPG